MKLRYDNQAAYYFPTLQAIKLFARKYRGQVRGVDNMIMIYGDDVLYYDFHMAGDGDDRVSWSWNYKDSYIDMGYKIITYNYQRTE